MKYVGFIRFVSINIQTNLLKFYQKLVFFALFSV